MKLGLLFIFGLAVLFASALTAIGYIGRII